MKRTEVLEKILAVERILQRNPNGITVRQIIDKLENEYGITAKRKSIYANICCLTRFMPIFMEKKGNKTFYCIQRSDTK